MTFMPFQSTQIAPLVASFSPMKSSAVQDAIILLLFGTGGMGGRDGKSQKKKIVTKTAPNSQYIKRQHAHTYTRGMW